MHRVYKPSNPLLMAFGVAGIVAVFAFMAPPAARAVGDGAVRFDKSCNSPNACAKFANAGVGPALLATETGGGSGGDAIVAIAYASGHSGVNGQTFNRSSQTINGGDGVYGIDESTDGGNANSGVAGFSTWGVGVNGVSVNAWGVQAVTYGGTGAVLAQTYSESNIDHHVSYGVLAIDDSLSSGANNGGLWAQSTNGVGIRATGNPSLIAVGSSAGAMLISAQSSAGATVATLDDSGNLRLSGKLYTAGSCKIGCEISGGMVRRAVAYVPTAAEPTMEDFGEADLTAGGAHVALDPAFANRIDERRAYLVFITAEGETDGLYVTNRSIAGFDVRENHHGRSNVGFSYRIVAKPYGASAERLPMETTRMAPAALLHFPRRSLQMPHP
jgi:hypothetical protein